MKFKFISLAHKFSAPDRLEVTVACDQDADGGGFNAVSADVVINKPKEELFALTLAQIEEIAIAEAKKIIATVD